MIHTFFVTPEPGLFSHNYQRKQTDLILYAIVYLTSILQVLSARSRDHSEIMFSWPNVSIPQLKIHELVSVLFSESHCRCELDICSQC